MKRTKNNNYEVIRRKPVKTSKRQFWRENIERRQSMAGMGNISNKQVAGGD